MRKVTLVILLITVLPATAFSQVAAKVLSLQGRVEVLQSTWIPASVNQILPPGTAIRTGEQSRAVIILADETQIKINSNSQLVIRDVRQTSNLIVKVVKASGDQSSLLLQQGEAWLRSRQKPAQLRIGTPAVTAAIRGTEFDVKVAEDGETLATVLEGSIDFRNDQGFVLVNPGEQGRARVGMAPTKTVLLNPQDAVQWTLTFTAAVSPRDYPFHFADPEKAWAALSTASADPVRLAQLKHDAGDAKGALDALGDLATPSAAETRGWIFLEQNKLPEAITQLSLANAQSARVRLGLSIAHYRLGQFAEAYKVVRDAGDEDQLKIQKSLLDLIAGDAAASRKLLESMPATSPSYSLAQGMLASVYLAQNAKDKALEAAQRAIQSDPRSPSGYLYLSQVQQSFFDLPAALHSVEQALSLDPEFLQANIQYATLLFGSGHTGKAEEVIRRALGVAPEEAAAHATLGFIQLAQGKTTESRLSFERSLQLDSTRAEPHLGLGIADMRAGRSIDAVTEILAAASLEPRVALYQSYLGKAFYEQRKFEQSFTALESAKALDPRDPTPLLYSGIFQNDLNRPGAAVKDFEESIRLNDNRAVYRSTFLLDEDRATRNVNLAAAYNRLGLSEWANLQALRSSLSDPANSSSHLFLANTFLNLKGRTIAAGSELLLARLLLPVNTNSFNAFNDYTTLFELPRLHWSFEGSGGSFDERGSSLIASGGARRYAYSSVFQYDQTDGFRPVNGDSTSYSSANFVKFALAPHSDLLLSFVHQQTNGGDYLVSSPYVNEASNPNQRTFVRNNRAEIGYHRQLRPGSELVVVLSGQKADFVSDDPKSFQLYLPPYRPVDVHLRHSSRSPDLNLQAAHLFKIAKLQFKYGLDIFEGRNRNQDLLTFPNPVDRTELVIQELEPERTKVRFKSVFLQSDYFLRKNLVITAGLNYDWANYKLSVNEYDHPVSKWDPQIGFFFSPLESSTFRFAAMRVLQTHQQERLVPAHLDGFLANMNESTLTHSNSYNFGWDQRLGNRAFLRSTAFKRDRTIPVLGTLPTGEEGQVNYYGDFYGAGVTLNQFITERWTLVPEYTLTHSNDPSSIRHDHEASIGVSYIHPRGFSVAVKENYLNQHGRLGPDATSVGVLTTNLALSYEFPRKIGYLSLRVNNLTDRRYAFLADPLALDPRVPKRQISLLLRFNF